jgi:hypothetical protein
MITDGGKPKLLEENLPQCHFVNHKFHIEYHEIEPRVTA